MRLEYVSVKSGTVLDVVDLPSGLPPRYSTGAAQTLVESVIRRGGRKALPGWTNGYVQLREPVSG